jgi:hypothetical protein
MLDILYVSNKKVSDAVKFCYVWVQHVPSCEEPKEEREGGIYMHRCSFLSTTFRTQIPHSPFTVFENFERKGWHLLGRR